MIYETSYKLKPDRLLGIHIDLQAIPIMPIHSGIDCNIFIEEEKFEINAIIYSNGGEIRAILYGSETGKWVTIKSKSVDKENLIKVQFAVDMAINDKNLVIAKVPQTVGEYIELNDYVFRIIDVKIIDDGTVKIMGLVQNTLKDFYKSFSDNIYPDF